MGRVVKARAPEGRDALRPRGVWWRESRTPRASGVPREILRFQPGHDILLFDRGREALEDMLAAIDGAREQIHLETYILRSDEIGRRLLARLTDRARAGVEVRIILDAVGSRSLDWRALGPLRAAGGEVVAFNPPSKWIWRFRPRQRDHRKLLLIDGRVGYLGGLNIGDEYVAEEEGVPTWRDAHLRLEGPVLTELEALFLENWFRSGGGSFDWRPLVAREHAAKGEHSVAILADGPTYRRRRLRSLFVDELARARSHVLLASPYFAPGPRVLDALAAASDRGVRVELLIAGHSDHPLLRRAVREFVPRLLRAGVRIYEDPHRMMHAKLAVFDDAFAVVGTSNLDRQSLHHSCEVNAVIESEEVATWILDHFRPDGGEVVSLDAESIARRRLWTRWVDRVAAFWARL